MHKAKNKPKNKPSRVRKLNAYKPKLCTGNTSTAQA